MTVMLVESLVTETAFPRFPFLPLTFILFFKKSSKSSMTKTLSSTGWEQSSWNFKASFLALVWVFLRVTLGIVDIFQKCFLNLNINLIFYAFSDLFTLSTVSI